MTLRHARHGTSRHVVSSIISQVKLQMAGDNLNPFS